MSSPRLRTLLALLGLWVITAASGCAGIEKTPGRCVACCYDGCIVPTFSPQSRVAPPRVMPRQMRQSNLAMAY